MPEPNRLPKPNINIQLQPSPESLETMNQLDDALCQLISDRTGLTFKSSARSSVAQKIIARSQALGCPFLETYYQLLSEHSLESHQEWQQLSQLLTNGESFFFRDRGQVSALEHHLLPELIARNAATQKIRICSAGCATGEEAYSIAILLSQLIPHPEKWDILIYGVDLNPAAVEQARKGLYRPWSLRGLSPQQKAEYFHSVQGRYQIAPRFQQWVRFQRLNLVNDALVIPIDENLIEECTEEASEQFDLIICRNVFIYFTKDAIAKVLEKFHQALRPEGYLLAGHSELYEQNLDAFQVRALPGSLAFQRPAEGQRLAASMSPDESADDLTNHPNISVAPGSNGHSLSRSDAAFKLFQKAQTAFNNRSFMQALQHMNQSLALQPDRAPALLLMAQIRAALDHIEAAKHYCNQALRIDISFMPAHYMLAQIFTLQGNLAIAKRILKKIIYLDPTAVVAYLELSQIYEQENNFRKSTLMRQSALTIFQQQLSSSNGAEEGAVIWELPIEDLLND